MFYIHILKRAYPTKKQQTQEKEDVHTTACSLFHSNAIFFSQSHSAYVRANLSECATLSAHTWQMWYKCPRMPMLEISRQHKPSSCASCQQDALKSGEKKEKNKKRKQQTNGKYASRHGERVWERMDAGRRGGAHLCAGRVRDGALCSACWLGELGTDSRLVGPAPLPSTSTTLRFGELTNRIAAFLLLCYIESTQTERFFFLPSFWDY